MRDVVVDDDDVVVEGVVASVVQIDVPYSRPMSGQRAWESETLLCDLCSQVLPLWDETQECRADSPILLRAFPSTGLQQGGGK